MHKLVLKIKNNKNYKILVNILKHIDFVELEESATEYKHKRKSIKHLFGLWKNREIDLKKVRNRAWRT